MNSKQVAVNSFRRLPSLSTFTKKLFVDPLTAFRIAFGTVLFFSTIRFMSRGWITTCYVEPQFHFSFFAWVKPLPSIGMWAIFVFMAIAAAAITLNYRYRLALTIFFLLFTYVELLDKTYYLNHYYLVSSLCFLLLILPHSHRSNSHFTPRTNLLILRSYIVLVYFFAGAAKLNADWLIHAQPLQIWLPANAHLPLIGWLFDYDWVAYLFSWSGALFDLSIGFFMLHPRTRKPAFVLLALFHLLTGWLFQIGMFPYIMIACSLLFFEWGEESLRDTEIDWSSSFLPSQESTLRVYRQPVQIHVERMIQKIRLPKNVSEKVWMGVVALFFVWQIVMPLRHFAYPGDVNWTGEGDRFAWRVMVVEKAGMAFFNLTDRESGAAFTVDPQQYLTRQQAMQMSFQPDMLMQFAHFLGEEYDAEVRVESFVSVNGRPSRLLFDPTVDLTQHTRRNWRHLLLAYQ